MQKLISNTYFKKGPASGYLLRDSGYPFCDSSYPFVIAVSTFPLMKA